MGTQFRKGIIIISKIFKSWAVTSTPVYVCCHKNQNFNFSLILEICLSAFLMTFSLCSSLASSRTSCQSSSSFVKQHSFILFICHSHFFHDFLLSPRGLSALRLSDTLDLFFSLVIQYHKLRKAPEGGRAKHLYSLICPLP